MKDLEVVDDRQRLMLATFGELTPEQVATRIKHIDELYKSAMNDGTDYGKIPGVDKPSLFKPGGEKLRLMFGLGLGKPEMTVRDLPNGHREYLLATPIIHLATGTILGYGHGSCSTMESKYRWRKQYTETDVGPVPKEYWDIPRENAAARNAFAEGLHGKGTYRPKKKPTGWVLQRIEGDGERVENPDIADTYNTVLKIAEKRSDMDATIKVTGASGMFTQDVEDFAPTEAMETPPTADRPPKERLAGEGKVESEKDGTEETLPKLPTREDGSVDYMAAIVALVNTKVPAAKRSEYMRDVNESRGDQKKLEAIYLDLYSTYAPQQELGV